MARRRRSRRALGALGEPITGSLLLWGGVALVAWLLLKKKPDEDTGDEELPSSEPEKARLKDIAQRQGEPKLLPEPPATPADIFKDKLRRGLDAAKLERAHAAAMEDFFGPLRVADMLDGYIRWSCSVSKMRHPLACADARAYADMADNLETREESGESSGNTRPKSMNGFGAPLPVPLPGVTLVRPRIRVFPGLTDLLTLGLPREYEDTYYEFLEAYLRAATFQHAHVAAVALCGEDAGTAACQLAETYRDRAAPSL